MQFGRNGLPRTGGDAVAAAILAKAQAMIGADDTFLFMKSRGQRHPAVRADVAGDYHLAFNTIDNQLFVQQGGFHRGAGNIAGAGHRVPAAGQPQPVFRVKGAMGGGVGVVVFMISLPAHIGDCFIVVRLLLSY